LKKWWYCKDKKYAKIKDAAKLAAYKTKYACAGAPALDLKDKTLEQLDTLIDTEEIDNDACTECAGKISMNNKNEAAEL